MKETLTLDRLAEMRGAAVYSTDGGKIGSVEEIFYDEQTRRAEWVSVGAGFLGMKSALVPVAGADLREDGVYVPYAKDQVKNAPDIDMGGGEIAEEDERRLYSHYGLSYSERRSETVLPEGGPGREPAGGGEADLVRHEEELRVGKRETEAGRARLRKWVETEPVSEDVTVERERARVTSEPVDAPATGAEIGEQEVEVGLRREEPVVQKETVAKERVGLEKDVDVERETVADEVRKERVDVEGDVEKR